MSSKRPLRILLANENRGAGGAERFTWQLGKALQRQGHHVWLAGRLGSWLSSRDDLPFVPLSFSSEIDLSSHSQVWRTVRPLQLDVIHCNAARDLALFAPARRLCLPKARLIKSDHSFLDSKGSAWLRWCYRQCDRVVPVSQALRRHMEQHLGDSLRYQVIYNAMELPMLPIDTPSRLKEHYWIGYVGAFLDWKRTEDVVRASHPWLLESSQRRLLLAGDGPERLRLEQLCRDLGISEQVWMPGAVPDPLPYIAGLKMMVHGSPMETFSLVAMEAMSLRVPVVGYASQALVEVVSQGHTGYLSQGLEPEGLREGIELYSQNEELRLQHGESARKHVQQRFTWPVILPQWENLYREGSTSTESIR